MSPERTVLTEDQVAAAEAGAITHPIISIIDQQLPILIARLDGYSSTKANDPEKQRYVSQGFGQFADDLVGVGSFALEATDIIAIWAHLERTLFNDSGFGRYDMARVISAAYAVQGIEKPAFKRLPRHLMETGKLPDDVINDREGMLHIRVRLREIAYSVADIETYIYEGEDPMRLAMDLEIGDADAKRHLDEILTQSKLRRTPFLEQIGENWANGKLLLGLLLSNVLDLPSAPQRTSSTD